jgi:hypothetical protein
MERKRKRKRYGMIYYLYNGLDAMIVFILDFNKWENSLSNNNKLFY